MIGRPKVTKLFRPVLSALSLTVMAWTSLAFVNSSVLAQKKSGVWSEQEKPILEQYRGLGALPDDEVRSRSIKQLALETRKLPPAPNKLQLAVFLADDSTEGDFGHDTLQEVATTLEQALREEQPPADSGQPAYPYKELAELVRYEHVEAFLESPQFAEAMSKIEADDERRAHADFTLTDLEGNAWTLKNLRGKVVLVNFWATWCPPCRKEIPDLETLYNRFRGHGLVVLAISDEGASKLKPFISEHNVTFPVLLDPGRNVKNLFQVEGIPKTFVYDRDGKLAAEAMDMRTQKQFLEMLAMVGLQ